MNKSNKDLVADITDDIPPEKLSFIQYIQPALYDGRYQLTVTQKLEGFEPDIKGESTTTQKKNLKKRSQHIRILLCIASGFN